MSMLRNHAGVRPWQLKGPQGQVVNITQGQPVQFDLDDIPITTSGKIPNYLLGIIVTLTGSLVTTATLTTNTPVYWDRLLGLILRSVQVQNCWHGTPISQNHVLGEYLDWIEYFGLGGEHFSRRGGPSPLVAGTMPFKRDFFLPLMNGFSKKPHHSAQLALFYKKGQLILNTQLASVLTAFSSLATFTGLQVQASAVLLPDPEIRLAPGIELIDYQTPFAANNDAVELRGLGNASTLDGCETDAAFDLLVWLTQLNGQPGASTAERITRIGMPFRDVYQTTHTESVIEPFIHAMGGRRSVGSVQDFNAVAPNLTDFAGFPFTDGFTPVNTSRAEAYKGLLMVGLGIWPSLDGEASKLQTLSGTETYYLSLAAGGQGGSHHTFARQFKSWTPAKIADAKDEILRAGLQRGLYPGGTVFDWDVKTINKQNPEEISAKKQRYFPLRLVAKG
ncbi:MAG: hypothetical protein PHR30_18480 [Gallionellaceae bacterium]|nr:hypothetical protein [Gallionellaceae bacterium]